MRPTYAADDNDVSSDDYDYPAATSVPDDNAGRQYLDLIPERDDSSDEPLRLLAVFTKRENDVNTSGSGQYSDVTKRAAVVNRDDGIDARDERDSETDEQQAATYLEIV